MFVCEIGVADVFEHHIFKLNVIWRRITKQLLLHIKGSRVVVDILVENKYVIHFQTWYGF